MQYASARYAAHVAKNVIDVDNHEEFVDHMTTQFRYDEGASSRPNLW